jgi:hypothetical protein
MSVTCFLGKLKISVSPRETKILICPRTITVIQQKQNHAQIFSLISLFSKYKNNKAYFIHPGIF